MGAQAAQLLLDVLVAAIDLFDVADLCRPVGDQRRKHQRHAGPQGLSRTAKQGRLATQADFSLRTRTGCAEEAFEQLCAPRAH